MAITRYLKLTLMNQNVYIKYIQKIPSVHITVIDIRDLVINIGLCRGRRFLERGLLLLFLVLVFLILCCMFLLCYDYNISKSCQWFMRSIIRRFGLSVYFWKILSYISNVIKKLIRGASRILQCRSAKENAKEISQDLLAKI